MSADPSSSSTDAGWLTQLMARGKTLFAAGAGRRDRALAAERLYAAAVEQARRPAFYVDLGVPDTHDGRLELVQLHVILLLRRLQRGGVDGEALGQALFDAFFRDLDRSLREGGVGDLSVGKWVKKIGQQFYARAAAVEGALALDDRATLENVVATNVFAVTSGADDRAAAIAEYLLAADAALAHAVATGTPLAALRFVDIDPIHPRPVPAD